jgi:hypothetical protein
MEKSWKYYFLKSAGVYNVVWGMWVLLFPQAFFHLVQLPEINYPEIWQSVGMIVGVYGIGYWIAADDYIRHWPVLLVGFLGKLFGPIGAAWNIYLGKLPPEFLWINVFNDLIWLPVFVVVLLEARNASR